MRTTEQISIDGKGNEVSWQKAAWTNYFVDIQGDEKPAPNLKTRLKMLWDDEFFYFYAQMEEPHIWASLTERDDVIFHDNDFEIFIDPNGDTHNYYEFEVNAFNTVWDLMLPRPYRDGGRAVNSWNIEGLKSAVFINGTINDPSDLDQYWSVEVAIPWEALREGNEAVVPPRNGKMWRLNFSRVQWETEVIAGKYVKKKDATTGKNLKEKNWVWSPQRAIAMHEPEFWGMVLFSKIEVGTQRISIGRDAGAEETRQLLYRLHRNQVKFRKLNKAYSQNKDQLLDGQTNYQDGKTPIELSLAVENLTYHAEIKQIRTSNLYWHIDHTGRIWSERRRN